MIPQGSRTRSSADEGESMACDRDESVVLILAYFYCSIESMAQEDAQEDRKIDRFALV
jgi:hypothetical protein